MQFLMCSGVYFVCLFCKVLLAPFDVSPVLVFLAPRDAGLENVMAGFTFPALISYQCAFWYDLVLFGTSWFVVVLF